MAADRRLLAVPNVSEGRDATLIAGLAEAFAAAGVELLDLHSDATHNRSVLTLSGEPAALVAGLLAGAEATIAAIDVGRQEGAHPRIGALDVCPVVWPRAELREEARDAVGELAPGLAELGLPVFLYGELAADIGRDERAFFRRGGSAGLRRRMEQGELAPDLGPSTPHRTAGAVLVTERPPLAAFNVELGGATIDIGREVAALVRESGGGLPGVRAIAIELPGGRVQISTNVHDPVAVPLGRVLAEVDRHAQAFGAEVAAAELVGLVPETALDGYPADLEVAGEPIGSRTIEARLGTRATNWTRH
jgi:glutamate formiminotransferase